MGISAGILLARLVGGSLADALGWRGMLAIVAAVMASMALLAIRCLPDVKPARETGYLSVMVQLPGLLRNVRLIESAVTGGAWFFVFSLLWVTIMLHLQRPPLHLPAGTAGLFGLAGIVGLVLANYAGKLADRFGCRSVIFGGMVFVVAGIAILFLFPASLPGITLGIILFDLGVLPRRWLTRRGFSDYIRIKEAASMRFICSFIMHWAQPDPLPVRGFMKGGTGRASVC
jgi:predicted MFS family arabinose efflux permease